MLNKEQVYAIEAGVETASGTEQAARNQIALIDRPSFNPVAGGSIAIPTGGPSYGGDDYIPGAAMGTAQFQTQLNGVAAPGDAPDWGVFLRAMSHAETITPGSDVQYTPILSGAETITVVGHHDANQYKYVGSIVTALGLQLEANKLPQLDVSVMSRQITVAEQAAPAQPPFRSSQSVQTGITTLSVDGLDLCFSAAAVQFDITHTDPTQIVCDDPDEITNIMATFKGTVRDKGFNAKTWEDKFANTFVPVQITHGTAGGDRITLTSAEAKISDIDKNQAIGGVVAVSLILNFRKGHLPTWKID